MAKQTTVTVNGVEYTLQHPGARWYLQAIDRHTNAKGNLEREKYIEDLLKHVVVDPVVTIDDFGDDLGSLLELVSKIESFLGSRRQ